MTTQVQKNGVKYFIVHDGSAYVDTLRTAAEMADHEMSLIECHVRAIRNEKDKIKRRWRFQLRNNAAKRLQQWRGQSNA